MATDKPTEQCEFCKTVERLVDDEIYNTEQAKKNGLEWPDVCYSTLTPAIVSSTHRHDIFREDVYVTGRSTYEHFNKPIRFCPYCARDLQDIIAKLPPDPMAKKDDGESATC